MDPHFRSFKDRLTTLVSNQRLRNSYDADQLRIWVQDLEQYPSCESVPFEDWDQNEKHLEYLGEMQPNQDHERAALLAFVRENKTASLQRAVETAL